MQPTSNPPNASNTTLQGAQYYLPELIEDYAVIEAKPSVPASLIKTTLIEYPNQMLVNRLVSRAVAVTNTGTRLVDGYRNPNRLESIVDQPANIPDYTLKMIQWFVNYQGYQLRSQHLDLYLKYLLATSKQRFEVILETLILKADTGHTPTYHMNLWLLENQQTKAPKPDQLFIPFIYNRYYIYPQHIVMIEVNFKEKAIYYYDSQGIPTNHYTRNVFEGFHMTLELDKLKEKAFGADPDAKIICSRYVHQQDCHNCGVYCCDYIERRINGESFEQIDRHGKNAEAIEQTRLDQGLLLSKAVFNNGDIY